MIFMTQMVFAGGPWTKAAGTYYLKVSQWWTVFDQHYTDQGLLDPNVTTGVYNTSLFLEYGLTDRFTGIVNAPLFSRNVMNNIRSRTTGDLITTGEGINGLGDIDISFKYSLSKPGAKFPVALTATFGLPTGITGGGQQRNLQTGDGEFNQMLILDAGTGFNLGEADAYLSAYGGVNRRTNGFSEEFRYGVEFGLGLVDSKLWLTGRLTAVESFKNGDTAETTTSTSIFANNAEFVTVGAELSYYVTEKLGVSVSAANAVRGEIIAAAPAYSVGVFIDVR